MAVHDLRNLSRDELIARAEAIGVHRPSTLTKAELLDEIVRRDAPPESRAKVRGWLGVARDLLARVIDRGLHLPEAAQLFRGAPVPSMPKPPPPLPTVTLAEIYGAQGYYARAVGVLDEVLAREPDHAEARALRERFLAQLTPEERASASHADEPPVSEEPEAAPAPAPSPDADTPAYYDVDEVVALPTDPHTAYVYWELRPLQLARARYADPSGRLVLRVLSVAPCGMSTEQTSRDVPVDQLVGDRFLRGLTPACELRLCIGWAGEAGFLPLVIAPELKMPRDDAGGQRAATFNGATIGVAWAERLQRARAAGGSAGAEDAPSRAAARRLESYLGSIANGQVLPMVDMGPLPGPAPRGGASDLYPGRAALGGASDLSQRGSKQR